MPKGTDSSKSCPLLQQPWRTRISLLVLAAPILRRAFSSLALGHLHTRILVEPKALAYVLLSRLGASSDPVFAWHVLDLLLRVPDTVFQDEWVALALFPLQGVPGASARDRIQLCQHVVFKTFGLWKAVAQAASAPVEHA